MKKHQDSQELEDTEIEHCLKQKYTLKEILEAFFAGPPDDCEDITSTVLLRQLVLFHRVYGDN